MADDVVLYHQDACAGCRQVERFLRERGIPFTAKDIGRDPTALREFAALGYLTTPVTIVDGTPVPGFQPKRLAALLARVRRVVDRAHPEDIRLQ